MKLTRRPARKLIAPAIAAVALTACNPYAPVDHVVITELEAGSVVALPGVDVYVRMITEGDFIDRCHANLGGEYHAVIGGLAHVCVVAG